MGRGGPSPRALQQTTQQPRPKDHTAGRARAVSGSQQQEGAGVAQRGWRRCGKSERPNQRIQPIKPGRGTIAIARALRGRHPGMGGPRFLPPSSSYWPQTHPLDVPKKLLQIQTTVQAPNSSKRAECAKGAIPIPCSDTLPLKPLWEGSRPIASIAKGEIHTPCR
jgi:hypothetical protein